MHNNRLKEQVSALGLGYMMNALDIQWPLPGTYAAELRLLLEYELLQRDVTKVAATASGLACQAEHDLKRQQMGEQVATAAGLTGRRACRKELL